MKKLYLIVVFMVVSFMEVVSASNPCNQCEAGGNDCWATASLAYIDSSLGEIAINVEYYESAADPDCGYFDVRIARECTTSALYYFDMTGCGIECWNLNGQSGYCDACGFWSFFRGNYTFYILTWGKGTVIVSYQGNYILVVEFDFGNYESYGRPVFDYVKYLNRDYSDVLAYDKFDPVESIAIEAKATWLDRIAPTVMIDLTCDFTGQSMTIEVPLIESQGHTGVYQALFPPSFLSHITGDPESLPIWGTEITAEPLVEYCGEETAGVKDKINIVNYIFTVEEVSFLGDYKLFKDSAGVTPPMIIPINDPVWNRTPIKNEAVAYKRNTPYKMNVLIKSSEIPFHDFQYKVKATESYEGRWYNAAESVRHFAFANRDTIKNITPDPIMGGPFPDNVDILEDVNFHWAVNKIVEMGSYGYEYINSSGPHKIFLTYDKPKLDTVNTLALDKICKYAEKQNVDTMVARCGVTGTYKERWDYDPEKSFIFADPLDVIRQRTGICSDYANLLTTLYRSVGVNSNPVVIFNIEQGIGSVYRLFWSYTELANDPPCCVLTKKLAACDTPIPQFWPFWYHAVAQVNSYYCDATLNLFRPAADYGAWWRYYVYPKSRMGPYRDDSPPIVPPSYREIDNLINAQNIFPPNMVDVLVDHEYP